jgi:hypothetical protein
MVYRQIALGSNSSAAAGGGRTDREILQSPRETADSR